MKEKSFATAAITIAVTFLIFAAYQTGFIVGRSRLVNDLDEKQKQRSVSPCIVRVINGGDAATVQVTVNGIKDSEPFGLTKYVLAWETWDARLPKCDKP